VRFRREGLVYTPTSEKPVESGDELLFVCASDSEEELERLLAPVEHGT
jgi:trk system potassium uptake protein TrkA